MQRVDVPKREVPRAKPCLSRLQGEWPESVSTEGLYGAYQSDARARVGVDRNPESGSGGH